MIAVLQLHGWHLLLTEYMDSVMLILDDEVLGTTGQQATYCVMVSTSADVVEPDSDISSDTAVVEILCSNCAEMLISC